MTTISEAEQTVNAREINSSIETALKDAEYVQKPDPDQIEATNSQAIEALMQGKIKTAQDLFIQALASSGKDDELRGRCLINIGDFIRRTVRPIEEAISAANQVFAKAAELSLSVLTRSRLKAMEAMVYILQTETGKPDQVGIELNIKLLKEAVILAQQGYFEGAKASLEAESFALHRLAGTVCNYGSTKNKSELLPMIEEFIPKLPDDSAEINRLNYSKAMIIAEQDRKEEAIRLITRSAIRIHDESPLDAIFYQALAADWCLDLGRNHQAQSHFAAVEKLEPLLSAHTNIALTEELIAKIRKRLSLSQ